MSGVTVRRLEPRDLEAVVAIESAALPWAAHWTPESYLAAPESGMLALVAEQQGRTVGFLLARYLGAEMEILNLAVTEQARREGVGRRLVQAALKEGERRSAASVFLEVRESNAAALAFYAALGFSPVGQRVGYYQEPAEDALVLSLPLPRTG
jgi:ribosomal-protein-alanine N-acetyltransferase